MAAKAKKPVPQALQTYDVEVWLGDGVDETRNRTVAADDLIGAALKALALFQDYDSVELLSVKGSDSGMVYV